MTKLEEFRNIIDNYKNGLYGYNHLTLREILERANANNLIEDMSLEEIDELINSSTGFSKGMFILLKEEKTLKLK